MRFEIVIALVVIVSLTCGVLLWLFGSRSAHHWLRAASRPVGLSLIVLPLLLLGAWQLTKSRTFQLCGEIVPRVETTAPLVALTFDDGPTPQYTEEVLAVLREHQVKATFFVTGRELEQHMDQGRRIAAEGHELGNHTYSHARMVGVSPGTIAQEIESTDRLIRAAGYTGEIHFRPPGSKKLFLLPYYLARTGRKDILCDVEPDSYPEIARDADKIIAHILEKARPGSIILLHVMYPSRDTSRQALPGLIQGLEEKGYRFVTVSELLAAR